MKYNPGIKIGDKISNHELRTIFQCANMGGMRRSKATGTLVIISDDTKGLYKDRWENDVLHYIGMGKVGDQVLSGNQNSTLYNSDTNGVEVHLFEVKEPKVYEYYGVVKLVDKPYKMPQLDDNKNMRDVWVFPVAQVKEHKAISPEVARANQLEDEDLFEDLCHLEPDEIDIDYIHIPAPKEKQPPIFINQIAVNRRDRKTAWRALAFAKHLCEIDNQHKSFIRKWIKVYYMEPHHLIPLAYADEFDVSLDVEENIVSLCSNCHNQLHYGEDYEELLWTLYQSRKELLEKAGIVITFERLKKMYQ